MELEREVREDTNDEPSQSPTGGAEENMGETPDSQQTNGFTNGDGALEGAAEGEAEAEPEEGEGDGDAMELEEGLTEDTSYIGDNCISTPAHTESNSPTEEQDQEMLEESGDAVGEGEGVVDGTQQPTGEEEEGGDSMMTGEGSPDQSVSSNTTPDQDISGKDAQSIGDVASSDDISPSGIVSSATSINQSEQQDAGQQQHMELLLQLPIDNTLQNQGISSSTLDGSSTTPSSSTQQDDLLCSSTNLLPIVNSAADTSALLPSQPDASSLQQQSNVTAPTVQPPYQQNLITNSSSTMAVSSSDLPIIQQQVSSTCSGNEDSSVSSNTNTSLAASNGLVGGDALATLASAALNRQNSQVVEKEEEPWYTVGIVKGTTFTVHNFISDPKLDLSGLSIDNIPDLNGYETLPLEPGTGYKFRVAAINSCGRGDFGEESPFKTCVPGYPGAPSDIKISKSTEGAHLSWEPPQASPEGIFEYSVYLAVRPLNPTKSVNETKSQLTFVRVYCGKETWCVVGQSSLINAHVDSSTKPAIIFRIAARNDKGYGPATQVRWLQENKSNTAKRIMDGRPQGPPPKQAKPMH